MREYWTQKSVEIFDNKNGIKASVTSSRLIRVLKECGLTDNEARVYLALLSLGSTSVLKVADQSGVKRTSVYSILQALAGKGLVNSEVRGFKRRFAATAPASVKALLGSKLALLEECMGDLTALYNAPGTEPAIRHYRGLKAVKGLYEELLEAVQPGEYYCVLTDMTRWESLDPRFFASFVQRRARKNVNLRILSLPSAKAARRRQSDRQMGGILRYLPETMNVTTNLIITARQVVFHQLAPPVDAVSISNRSIVNLQYDMFRLLWEGAN